MGEKDVKRGFEGEQLRLFMSRLMADLRAVRTMLESGAFDDSVQRIGAEQEMFLVDRNLRPAPVNLELLDRLADEHFTTEIAAFNLEVNLDPIVLGAGCLSALEHDLDDRIAQVRAAGEALGVEPVLVGILPTIRQSDLGLSNLTGVARYAMLNEALHRLRGDSFEFRIKGLDDLLLRHDNVLIEGCNTSFQVHLQIPVEQFVETYNIAQLTAAPVLAAATNSPMLFARRLWRETRIALFQQSVDTRTSSDAMRGRSPRVTFGTAWVDSSPLDLFREDVARFRPLLAADVSDDPFAQLARGEAPSLRALRVFNGTVYRWNRACYGISDGKPHIRIENRILPSGPTVLDEVANAAFWIGLMKGLPPVYGDVRRRISFDEARQNFTVAARVGLGSKLRWLDGETVSAQALICDRLVPVARDGLISAGVNASDADRYLEVVFERVASGRTGAEWMLASFAATSGTARLGPRLNAITSAIVSRQKEGRPVAKWDLARIEESGGWMRNFVTVENFMTTDLFTVSEEEPVDLVANLMDWRNIRHVPVEDSGNRLVGIVSYRAVLRLVASGWRQDPGAPTPVSEIMRRNPVTIEPETPTLDAIAIMRDQRIGALPVVKDGKLIGIVTERDFMDITRELLAANLHAPD